MTIVLTSLVSADVDGKGVTLNLGPAATIKNTNIAGSGNVVKGTGSVGECKIAEGATASVEIAGANVEGDNVYQPIISAPVVPDSGEVEPEVPAIVLQPLYGDAAVKCDGNKATIDGQYKSAYYTLPSNIDGSKVTEVNVVVTTDNQLFVKVVGVAEKDVKEAWVGAGSNKTVTVPASASAVKQIEFMTLDKALVNIEVISVDFTLSEAEEDDTTEGGDTGSEAAGAAIDLATKVAISGNAPTESGSSLAFAAGNNKCAFTLPAAVAAGEKVTFTVDMDLTDVATNSTIRFYLIKDSADQAVSDQAYIKTPELDSTSVQKTLTLTASGDATQLMLVTFAWDGSTPQDLTLNGITVQ